MSGIGTVTAFPRKVREIENLWIPMPDGVKLAARIWLPEDAEADPVPAILEYLPYRKRDGTVERDQLTHPYFAGHGYAGVRVDMRGTGDSEGVCRGEYLQQEQDDALAVISWLAEQGWCSGAVGMIGISWGGFNGLQVAALRPKALRAVVTICSTDDRYADDIHFMGGAVLTDKLWWGGTAFAIANTPPDPEIVGPRWREMWLERLRENGCWPMDWFRHQRRDAFYRHGSICEDWSAVQVPVYAVGGWADGYTNAVFRLMEKLQGPKKGLIGPWAHKYPHFAKPGPRIGFLQECLRWWDQHLKGVDTGIMDEPALRAWLHDPAPPAPWREERAGRWVAEPGWPAPEASARVLTLSHGALTEDAAPAEDVTIRSPLSVGAASGSWCAFGVAADGPLDQRAEAGGSLVFDTAPLDADFDLLGFPVLDALVACDKPVGQLVATLSAVAEDGAATLLSWGVLNLTHRRSHAAPEPMIPGQAERVSVQLNACGQRVAQGERLRLALSTCYWPVVWPTPEAATLTITTGETKLTLPVRAPRSGDAALPAFGPPEGAAPFEIEMLREAGPYLRRSTVDLTDGSLRYERAKDHGDMRHLRTGITVSYAEADGFTAQPNDPATAAGRSHWRKSYSREDWRAEIETEITVEARRDVWRVTASLIARDAEGVVLQRDWLEEFPRDLV